MNAKISVFPIGFEAIIHLILYNLLDCTCNWGFQLCQSSSSINFFSLMLLQFDIAYKCIRLLDCGWNFMSMTLAMFKLPLLIVYLLFKCVHSSHFCGATISWKPSDKEGEVNVKFLKQLFSFAPKNSCSEISKICPNYNILHLFSVIPAIFFSFQRCIQDL